jgi:hypothetical protein
MWAASAPGPAASAVIGLRQPAAQHLRITFRPFRIFASLSALFRAPETFQKGQK